MKVSLIFSVTLLSVGIISFLFPLKHFDVKKVLPPVIQTAKIKNSSVEITYHSTKDIEDVIKPTRRPIQTLTKRRIESNVYGGVTILYYTTEDEFSSYLYNKNGILRESGVLKNNLLNGAWNLYNNEGIKKRETIYANGLKTEERLFSDNGEQTLEISFQNGVRISENAFKEGRSIYQLIFNEGATVYDIQIVGYKYDKRGLEKELTTKELLTYSKLHSPYNKVYSNEVTNDIKQVISDKTFCHNIKNSSPSKQAQHDYYNYTCNIILQSPYS